MSGIFKSARWDFVDGPLENHLGFVGEDVGGCVEAIEVEFKRGEYARYEKTGRGVEEVFDGSERVFYSIRHVPRPNADVDSRDEIACPVASCSGSSAIRDQVGSLGASDEQQTQVSDDHPKVPPVSGQDKASLEVPASPEALRKMAERYQGCLADSLKYQEAP